MHDFFLKKLFSCTSWNWFSSVPITVPLDIFLSSGTCHCFLWSLALLIRIISKGIWLLNSWFKKICKKLANCTTSGWDVRIKKVRPDQNEHQLTSSRWLVTFVFNNSLRDFLVFRKIPHNAALFLGNLHFYICAEFIKF